MSGYEIYGDKLINYRQVWFEKKVENRLITNCYIITILTLYNNDLDIIN